MSDRTVFTSESVTEGHPDKIADQVSDGVLDAILTQDPLARVACETLLTTGLCVVAGEISTTAVVDISAIGDAVTLRLEGDIRDAAFTLEGDIRVGVELVGLSPAELAITAVLGGINKDNARDVAPRLAR